MIFLLMFPLLLKTLSIENPPIIEIADGGFVPQNFLRIPPYNFYAATLSFAQQSSRTFLFAV